MNGIDELQHKLHHLLPSQKFWLESPERERIIMAGFRAGKTQIGCLAGILFSYLVPGNFGFIGRATATNLPTTTLDTFLKLCPEDMIVGRPKAKGQVGKIYKLRTKEAGRYSEIYFDYIIDKQSGKSHLAGGNWGWFFVDQVEEIGRNDWAKLTSRLSRTTYDSKLKRDAEIRTHALGAGNQAGHDWIWEDFYREEVKGGIARPGNYVFAPEKEPKVFYKSVHRDLPTINEKTFARLGVVTRAEENKISNGGFVPDDYFDAERAARTPEWIARYLDGSFDDFSGKIYKDFNLDSVHNIKPFEVPKHWPWYVAIDPGGSAPWGIVVLRMDEAGNAIVTSCADEVYNVSRINPNDVVKWIHSNVPVDRARFIIDYQNIPVMTLFQDAGIHCEPAMKDIKVGITGAQSWFQVAPERKLPVWFRATQPKEMWEKFEPKGSPKVFVFDTCTAFRKEHDNWIWDTEGKDQPKKGQADHTADCLRYLFASHMQAAAGIVHDPYAAFRSSDPTSAVHLDQVQRELRRLRAKDAAARERAMDPDSSPSDEPSGQPHFIQEFGNYF